MRSCDGVLPKDYLPGETSDSHQCGAAVCGKGIGKKDGLEAEAISGGKASNFGLLGIIECARVSFNRAGANTRKLPAIGCGDAGIAERAKETCYRSRGGQDSILSYIDQDVRLRQQLCRELPGGAVIKL